MNLTVHMTADCNMDCAYCTRSKRSESMSREVLTAACELAFSRGTKAGISFFGGEPLLRCDDIMYALDLCADKSEQTGLPFACKMTTNGTLLDEAFLTKAKKAGMVIGLSFDGVGQDICRQYCDGSGSMADVEKKARLLLSFMPAAPVLMTIAPQTAHTVSESVTYLRDLGFGNISCTPAYGKNVRWTDDTLDVLMDEYAKVGEMYERAFADGRPFRFTPFDAKISQFIKGINPASRCHLGSKQVTVVPDGRIYPCTQFMYDENYCLGNVFDGISYKKREGIAARYCMPEPCRECDLKERCTNSCGCLNRLETGDENSISALQCSYERALISMADEIAERLISNDEGRFRKRFEK